MKGGKNMKKTKDELLEAIRTHGGEEPDDFTISMLEDISDSFVDAPEVDTSEIDALKAANAELEAAKSGAEAALAALKKAYADRFTLKEEEIKEEEDEPEEEEFTETFDSIFED